jgi:hypothetical protein
MAIDALNTTAQGLISSERRATQIAQDIVTGTSAAADSFSNTLDASDTGAANTAPNELNVPASGPAASPLAGGAGFGDVIQQLANLRIEENVFRASASAFSRINETFGSLLDQES